MSSVLFFLASCDHSNMEMTVTHPKTDMYIKLSLLHSESLKSENCNLPGVILCMFYPRIVLRLPAFHAPTTAKTQHLICFPCSDRKHKAQFLFKQNLLGALNTSVTQSMNSKSKKKKKKTAYQNCRSRLSQAFLGKRGVELH